MVESVRSIEIELDGSNWTVLYETQVIKTKSGRSNKEHGRGLVNNPNDS